MYFRGKGEHGITASKPVCTRGNGRTVHDPLRHGVGNIDDKCVCLDKRLRYVKMYEKLLESKGVETAGTCCESVHWI